LLWEGGLKEYHGDFFSLQEARLYTLPDTPPPIAFAAGGPRAAGEAARVADGLITTEPRADLVQAFRAAGGQGKPVYGQQPVCWGEDEASARKAAHDKFRFGLLGWKVQSELPGPVNFEAASKFITEDDVAEMVPYGPDPERTVDALQKWADAGFDRVALLQADPTREEGFLKWWRDEVAPRMTGATLSVVEG
jgi:G6PDH family F420-dependent oxidoreductase